MENLLEYSKFEPNPDLHKDFEVYGREEYEKNVRFKIKYKDIDFKYTCSRKEIGLSKISIVDNRSIEDQMLRSGYIQNINVYFSRGKIDFNSEFMDKFDDWIIEYKRFLSQYSSGHIDDLLSDMDGVDIVKSLTDSFRIYDGFSSDLQWFVDITLKSPMSFKSDLIRNLSDFVERMESFGFDCDNSLSNRGFSIKAKKNILK